MALAILGVIGTAVVLGLPQETDNWTAVARSDDVVIGLDRGSVSRVGDIVTFTGIQAWLRSDSAYLVADMKVDCTERSLRLGSRSTYDREGGKLATYSTESPPVRIESNWMFAEVVADVCDAVRVDVFATPTALSFYRQAVIELTNH